MAPITYSMRFGVFPGIPEIENFGAFPTDLKVISYLRNNFEDQQEFPVHSSVLARFGGLAHRFQRDEEGALTMYFAVENHDVVENFLRWIYEMPWQFIEIDDEENAIDDQGNCNAMYFLRGMLQIAELHQIVLLQQEICQVIQEQVRPRLQTEAQVLCQLLYFDEEFATETQTWYRDYFIQEAKAMVRENAAQGSSG